MKLRILLATLLTIGALNGQQPSAAPRPQCCKPCKPPTYNCPPKVPCCNPCDCIFDFYNPLVFNGWNTSIEWLYWKVAQKASTFVLTPHGIHQSAPPATIADSVGKYKSAKFNWNSGVRIGVDYTFVRDAWNLLGQYTYYSTGGTENVFRPSDPSLYLEPTVRGVVLPPPSDGVDHMICKSHLNYQGIDLLLSRRYLPGCQILLDVFTGPTVALINEGWKVLGFYTVGALPPVITETTNRWKFDGGGVRMGVNADWHMGCGMGLYQKFSFAGLIGSYSNTRRTKFTPPDILIDNQRTHEPIRDTEEHATWVVPNTQIAFGLTWNHRFRATSMRILAGLEANTWYDLHQVHQDGEEMTNANHDRLDIENSSAVNLWGLNLGIDFSF